MTKTYLIYNIKFIFLPNVYCYLCEPIFPRSATRKKEQTSRMSYCVIPIPGAGNVCEGEVYHHHLWWASIISPTGSILYQLYDTQNDQGCRQGLLCEAWGWYRPN